LPWGNLVPVSTYTAGRFLNADGFFLFSFYAGAVTLFCLSLYLTSYKKKYFWRPPTQIFLCGMLVLLLAMGAFSPVPLYQILWKYFPFWKSFRYPERLTVWPVLSICVWSSLLLRRFLLLRHLQSSRNLYLLAFPTASVLLAFITAEPLKSSLIHLGIALFLAFGIYIFLLPRKKMIVLLLLVFSFDLAWTAHDLVWDQSSQIFTADYPAKNLLEHAMGSEDRMTSTPLTEKKALFANQKLNSLESSTFAAWEAMVGNVPVFYGFSTVDSASPLVSAQYKELKKSLPQEIFWDLFSVRYILRRNSLGVPELVNGHPLPYIWWPSIVQTASLKKAQRLLSERSFATGKALVDESPGDNGTLTFSNPEAEITDLKRTGRGMDFFVKGAGEHFLVLQESFDQNWHAYQDEHEMRVLRVNRWAIGFKTTTGHIHLRYENPFIQWGFTLSVFWLICFLIALVKKRAKRSRKFCVGLPI
jgi:hypothetical protein